MDLRSQIGSTFMTLKMFSGAYDHGKAPFPEEFIPYTLSRENLIYVATRKENCCANFPTGVMM